MLKIGVVGLGAMPRPMLEVPPQLEELQPHERGVALQYLSQDPRIVLREDIIADQEEDGIVLCR